MTIALDLAEVEMPVLLQLAMPNGCFIVKRETEIPQSKRDNHLMLSPTLAAGEGKLE